MSTLTTPIAEPSPVDPEQQSQQTPNTPGAGVDGGATPPEGGDPASLLAGKFKSQEELVKAYQELEKKLGGSGDPADPSAQDPSSGERGDDDDATETDEATQALQVAGLDIGEFTAEFNQNGNLSDASYSKLEAAGFPKAVVDQYIRGQQVAEAQNAVTQQTQQKVLQDAEVSDFQALSGWASQNLSQPEIETFNRIMDSGDPTAMTWALQGLKSKYTKAVGSDPNLIHGGNAPTGDVYQSTAQVVEDMKDPRYKTDPAYRDEVAQKLKRSNVFKRG